MTTAGSGAGYYGRRKLKEAAWPVYGDSLIAVHVLTADVTLVDVLSCADRFHKTRRASLSNRSSCPSRSGDDTKPKRR